MAEPYTFYLPPEAWREPYTLDAAESHHLVTVLRLKPGAEVRLFDGLGRHGLFRVEAASKTGARLALVSTSREEIPAGRCTLAAGFSKALRRGWFMEKSVELEAAAVWFWQGEYSQAALPDKEKERWSAALIAGAKQCGAARLPELAMLKGGVEELVKRRDAFDRAFVLYEGDTGGRLISREELAAPGDTLLVVGPEGGFSPREIEVLTGAGIEAVSMGNRILRWETAALLALGLAWWARQGQ